MRKLITTLTLLLCCGCSNIQTTNQSEILPKEESRRLAILRKGDPAPFNGILYSVSKLQEILIEVRKDQKQ